MADSQLWEGLDRELNAMVDTFANLVKAARIVDEESEQGAQTRESRKERAPGELLEVWAEKLVHSGHTALHQISQLKRGALLNDFDALMKEVRQVRQAFDVEVSNVEPALAAIRRKAEALLSELEASYYSSSDKGRLITFTPSAELQELARLSMDVPSRMA